MRDKMILNVTLDKSYTLNLDDDLNIDRAGINDALANQPALFAWYATLYEMARNNSAVLNSQIDAYQAELDQYYRMEATKEGIKITEGSIKAKIDSNENMCKLIDDYNNSKRQEGMLYAAKAAFEQRKDMLISIASNMRQEWDTELKINKDKVREVLRKGQPS